MTPRLPSQERPTSGSAARFLAQFQARQLAKGHDLAPLFASLVPELPAVAPEPARMPQVPEKAPTARPDAASVPTTRVRLSEGEAVRTLTACLDAAPCRATARRIFRLLYALALYVARYRGLSELASVVVFHLPAELLYGYLEIGKSAFYDNLKQLTAAGLVSCEAHLGPLEGHARNVATGTLWAVSLAPERVLSGQRAPARLTREDWQREWRNLDQDRKAGRTAASLLGIVTPRENADEDGKTPSSPATAGQSIRRKRLQVPLKTLKDWAITPFSNLESDTETVRQGSGAALDVVWTLGDAAAKSSRDRAAMIDAQARTLAAAFGDSEGSLNFWRKLIWNITRGIEAGCDLSDDVGAVLVRVLRDVQHDLSLGGTTVRNVGRVVNRALSESGLLDLLRGYEHRRVGVRPRVAA